MKKMTNQNTELARIGQEKMELTPELIKKYLCPQSSPSDSEVFMFMELCAKQDLNPFLREVYLIKYGSAPAQFVVAKDGFLKRANKDPKYEGHSVSCHTGPEGLVAVAKVYKKGFRNAIEVEVDFAEYVSLGKDGKPKALWATKPKTMLKKVALCQALRETFPDSLGGMYSREELNVDDLDSSPIVIDTRPIKPVSRLIEKPQVISDSRAWPEILEKYRPHLEDHGVSEVELGLMTADQFATLKGKVFGG